MGRSGAERRHSAGMSRSRRRGGRWAQGAPWRLPPPLDRVADGWAGLRPRVRTLLAWLLVLTLGLGYAARVAAVDARWGGPAVTVLRATRAMAVGEAPAAVEQVRLPPRAVPPAALRALPEDAVLALPVVEGALLVAAHLDARGPGAQLPADERVVPVPVEEGWAVEAGGWVDVWALGAAGGGAQLVARSRPVLQVQAEEGRGGVALVSLAEDQVREVTAGLATGRVVLAHAPPPVARE